MRQVGDRLRTHGVAAVYLVHGTFAGSDAWGILNEIERFWPSLGAAWRTTAKQFVDALLGDVGNYSPQYVQLMEEALNRPSEPRASEQKILVRRFAWSGENHHIGRADGAVRLIDELIRGDFKPTQRVLLWGHSHAGNVFALASNLLSGDGPAIKDFFAATRVYYHRMLLSRGEISCWRRVREFLAGERRPLPLLDLVTFGTPVRYGWDANGYGRLLHFVNHRPKTGLPPYRAPFPPREQDVRSGADGDYVQQLGIAGTNFLPNLLAWRALLADRRLGDLLQPGLRTRDLLERLRLGVRVPDEGDTLLVDYGPPQGNVLQHLAGHGVYTRPEWMLFHAEEASRRFYE